MKLRKKEMKGQTRLINEGGLMKLQIHRASSSSTFKVHPNIPRLQISLSKDPSNGMLKMLRKDAPRAEFAQRTYTRRVFRCDEDEEDDKPKPKKPSFAPPIELCLLIAQEHPLVAVKLHAVNKWFRDIIKKNLISMTHTHFFPGINNISNYDWYFKPCIRGLYFYHAKRMPNANFNQDVNSLKSHIRTRFSDNHALYMRFWLLDLPEEKLTTADARAYMTKVVRATRAYYGSKYLALGNDERGTRKFALTFLALAEEAIATQFRAQRCYEAEAFKFTCRTNEIFRML